MINIDETFFIQLMNFLITLVALNLLLIRPIREIIKKRGDLMADQADKIDGFNSSAERKVKDYEAALVDARKQGVEIRNAKKDEAAVEEHAIMGAAGEEAAATMKAAQVEIAKEVDSAMGSLKNEVGTFATQATNKILGQA